MNDARDSKGAEGDLASPDVDRHGQRPALIDEEWSARVTRCRAPLWPLATR